MNQRRNTAARTPRGHGRRAVLAAIAAIAAALCLVSGCGFDPSAVSVPGSGIAGPKYGLRIEFANTLNLPSRAKVTVNGLRAGIVRDMTLIDAGNGHDSYVVVDVDIMSSVQLPVGTTAELRQPTILGDVSIALTTPPSGGGATLAPGATIGRAQTKPLLQLEDTMNVMAAFVQGGGIQRAQEIINRANAILPSDPKDTASISEVLGSDIKDLAAHVDAVDSVLDGLRGDTEVILRRTPDLDYLLTDAGVDQAAASMTSMIGLITLYDGFKLLTESLRWVGPLAQSGAAAARAFVPLLFTSRPLDLSAPSNLNKIVSILHDEVIPFAEHEPKVNITGVQVGNDSGAARVSDNDRINSILTALHAIGVVR
ncbi:mammalian cell entry protein [Nocardia sp. 852002-20019_SCH5090214]|uniref:MCE family protein n=1 Tax=Nocardia nova TaxID=37330 RepID=A0A2S5ZWK1_9NOCA|nr:MCE family protein [Nocardia nova]OBA41005.1 mammalian cell entry protein [Nocardia sp. 852002-51101_SCH5132738]OBA50082.1 mammalian cell entry protein [Nocardia sp. 852002-20019_SCH5090214]OBB52968.1 mammalian cell entry protein [Nocardia sp. 852002-51244_SCH5132740]OBF68452.1 mammalian cell entry protein [Mycobacterium sp. 852002-51759_SCH5129042]